MKAQSGIEYLITYGWAVIALGVVTGGIYSYTDSSSCDVETDVFHPDLRVEEAGLNSQNQLQMLFRSSSNDQIRIREVNIGGQSGVTQGSNLVLEPGETEQYLVAEGNESNGCAEMDITIVHDRGPVQNQRLQGTIRLPVTLVEAVINYLSVGGGQISELRINASLVPNESKGLCIGNNCPENTVDSNELVARSGDNMTGTLTTSQVEVECFGDNCAQGPQTLPGNVSSQNNTMDGNLQLPSINPSSGLTFTGFQD
ncbi:MAG: hypothetical protein R6V35_02850 [Candidatus Nanohaloarchaea archaeon]